MAKLEELIGKTLVEAKGEKGDGVMRLKTSDGVEYEFLHHQDCCESVQIEDVVGDLNDLIGSPITEAEEVSSADHPAPPNEYVESYTWTFYKLGTRNGSVTVRWLGESNGYYSESVDFVRNGESLW